jgi:hypothetical protein
MSENRVDLAPSPLVGDAFSLTPTRPSAIGTHYLQIAVELDVAWVALQRDIARWTPGTPARRIGAQRAAAATAIAATIQEVSATQWPTVAEPLANHLVAAGVKELAQLRRAPTLTEHGLRRWVRDWRRHAASLSAASRRLRRALDLPQLSPIVRQS